MESPWSEEFEFGQTFRVAGEGAPGEKKPKLFPRISYKPRWSIWLRHMQYKDTESHIDQTSCSTFVPQASLTRIRYEMVQLMKIKIIQKNQDNSNIS